jgi:phosphate transport system substrate-binding protein
MSRLPKDSEVELGIEHIAFAYDPVVVATSGDVELVGLTSQQVRSIFDGTATNWAEFGGPDSLITVLTREEDDSNTKIMRNGIIGDTEFAPGSLLVTSEDELKAAIVKIPSSIGYMAHSGVQLDSLSVNVMALDGYQPSDADPNYPLENRILGVAYLPANTSKVQRFLEFITGKEAASFLSENGIPPLYQGR